MKVVCIASGPWKNCDTNKLVDYGPKYGEICTVTSVREDNGYYDLLGYDCPDSQGWARICFVEILNPKIERVAVTEELREKVKELQEENCN